MSMYRERRNAGRILAIVLSIFMLTAFIPVTGTGKVYAASDIYNTLPAGSSSGYTLGASGSIKTYTLEKSASFTNTSGPGMSVAENASVILCVPPGVKLTAAGSNGSGATPGYPGISVPENSNLMITGGGIISASGGNAGSGAAGTTGGAARIWKDTLWNGAAYGGDGEPGGNGGGGAAAGIGGAGGEGGAGSDQVSKFDTGAWYIWLDGHRAAKCSSHAAHYDHYDTAGTSATKAGADGQNGADAGLIAVLGNTYVYAKGGEAGVAGKAGAQGRNADDAGTSWVYNYAAGGGGPGGGGGAGGQAEYGIGGGAAAGGGGGAGGSGATYATTQGAKGGREYTPGDGGGGGGSAKGLTVEGYVTLPAGGHNACGRSYKKAVCGNGSKGGASGVNGQNGWLYVSSTANVESIGGCGERAAENIKNTSPNLKYKIVLDGEDALEQEVKSVDAYYGISGSEAVSKAKITKPIKKGYRFAGYYSGRSGEGTMIYDEKGKYTGNFVPLSGKTLTAYAYWKKQVTVRLDYQGIGSDTRTSITVDQDSKIEKEQLQDPIITPEERNKFLFKGWFKDTEMSQKWDIDNDVVRSDMTLYAGWQPVDTAELNGVTYATLAKAVKKARNGDKISLIAPATETETINIRSDVEINLKGYDLTFEKDIVADGADVTIRSTGKSGIVTSKSGAKLIADSDTQNTMVIRNGGYKCGFEQAGKGKINITGGYYVEDPSQYVDTSTDSQLVIEEISEGGFNYHVYAKYPDPSEDNNKIILAKAAKPSVKAGKKQATVKAAAMIHVSGYQFWCKKKGSKAIMKTSSTQKVTFKKLKKGKRYTIKVRAFKVTDNDIIYGKWSPKKTIKI